MAVTVVNDRPSRGAALRLGRTLSGLLGGLPVAVALVAAVFPMLFLSAISSR